MITIEPEPMKGPPSWRCQTGAGNFARSTSAPVVVFCEEGRVLDRNRLMRLERLALLHPGLERVERAQTQDRYRARAPPAAGW